MPTADDTRRLLETFYRACNSGDIDGMLACVSDDVVHDVNQGERRVGKDRFHAFCARMAHHYREELENIVILVADDGRRASAEYNVRGVYLETEPGLPPASGQSYQLPAGAFFAIDDGRISRVTAYYNLTEWIMQVSKDMA